VQALGYDDFFGYRVSDYGMTTEELVELTDRLVRDMWPLYREIHTWARDELAERYGAKEVPDMLPAHWLPNRWGQDWTAMVQVEGLDIDGALEDKTAEWVVRTGEAFYRSLGFPALPQSFWELSSLYPLPPDAGYKKNNHASAWHLDLDRDVRSLMSVVPNAEWYETVHHELGHVYYFMSYSRPEVPIVLRQGANRAFHEAMGSLMGLASLQKPYLVQLGLVSEDAQVDRVQAMLREAMNYIVFMPWAAGVMTRFEYELYAENLPPERFNERWWELKRLYQGIVPPEPRPDGEGYCDAASKTHINNDPAQYYDYALSYALLFQLHDHIARKILHQDPHGTNYFGSREVGDFVRRIMAPGRTEDWRDLLRKTVGEELSAAAMLRYFEPLYAALREANRGRRYTLPEQPPF
jgi:peptidyl-dipeptidase A